MSQQFHTMSLESLANELLLDLLEYFDGATALCAFAGLHTRFHQLLFQHFRAYHFDFRRVSKASFDLTCQQHLPFVADRVVSLRLANDDETPDLPELFLSRGFTFDRFVHLKSLSLYGLRSLDLLDQLILQCRPLRYLTELNIISFYVGYDEHTAIALMNNIWSLNLTRCTLDNFYSGGECFFGIHVISTSLKYLSIENIYCDLSVIYHLIRHTPNLRCLSSASDYSSDARSHPTSSLSITSLQLSFEGSTHSFTTLLQQLPNLRRLTLKTVGVDFNGHDWEKTIRDFLPQIKVFQLSMNYNFAQSTDKDRQIDELLDTYRTDFWLHERHWYIRCNWDPKDIFNRLTLYTLPYPSSNFFHLDTVQSKSTAANESDSTYYDRVTRLRYHSSDGAPSKDGAFSPLRFAHIRNLNINMPYNNNLWLSLSTLEHLTSVDITVGADSVPSQLCMLLERVPQLFSLTLRSSSTSLIPLSNIVRITSIRRLHLVTKANFCLQYFTAEECHLLIHSPLAGYCEVLSVSVKDRTVICDLIEGMPNLRTLTFQCEDDRWTYGEASSESDQILQWLVDCLPATSLITRDKTKTSNIHVWLR